MQNFYIIAALLRDGFYQERVSVDYQELCNSGLTLREFLIRYGSFQREWALIDIWTGNESEGMIVTSWD